ncbi:MAG: MFS transporter [Bacteroidota bacterium]|nr:MFS transporter [Bacteroidota bacterium]
MEIWKKNLYTIWGAQLLAMVGMNLVVPFLPFFVRQLGVEGDDAVAKWSGIVFAGPFLLSLFFTPFWGAMGDCYGRKLMVVRAIFGLGISQALIGISPNVEFLLFFRMVQGAISGFISSALALVSSTTPKNKTGYAIGLLQAATAAGTVIGPLVGGFLADTVGYRVIFLIVAALCFIAGFMVIKNVKEDKVELNIAYKDITLKTNYKYVFKSPNIRFALFIILLTQIGIVLVQPIFALFIETFPINQNYVSTLTGVAYSIMGIFLIFSGPTWGKFCDKKGYRKNMTIATGGAAISFALQGFATSLLQIIFLRAMLGIFLGGILPSLYSYVTKNTQSTRRAGVMGIASSAFILANLIGPLSGGIVAAKFGIQETFLVSAILLFAASAVIFTLLKEPDISKEKAEETFPVK